MKFLKLRVLFFLGILVAFLVVSVPLSFCQSVIQEEDINILIQKNWDKISSSEKTALSGRKLTRTASEKGIYINPETPLVTEDERRSIAKTVPQECSGHFLEEADKLVKDKYSRDQWLRHISKCKKCCRPYMSGIITKHVAKIVNGPHVAVLFDFNEFKIKEYYKKKLRDLINSYPVEKDGQKVLLIGRASDIGNREINMQLSQSRVLAVKKLLIEQGYIKKGQSTYMLFGSQPPQLTSELAELYGIDNAEIEKISFPGADPDGSFRVNQSVIVAIYKSSE